MSKSPSGAAVREETEASLIARAQIAVSNCNWEVGECASLWTKRFARGRTDADFAVLVSLSPDQVYQRRRVWEAFADVFQNYPSLKWSHFYTALNWDDSAECLQWAEDVQAGVAEMKAWRRAQRGEDLDTRAAEEAFDSLPGEPALLREAAPPDQSMFSVSSNEGKNKDSHPNLSVSDRNTGDTEPYAPYKADATSVPPGESERATPSTEQLVKKLTTTIERCHSLITPKFVREFEDLPEKVRKRFLKATEQLADKLTDLA